MYKVLFGLMGLFFSLSINAQGWPNYADPQGYLLNNGQRVVEQNLNSMANWWGCKRGKITDTCPILISTKYGDSLYLYKISNYSGTDILVKFLGQNNKTDTIPVTIPSGGESQKLPRVWKMVSTSNADETLDSLVLWFQNGKKRPDEY